MKINAHDLLTPEAVRKSATEILKATRQSEGLFRLDESRLEWIAQKVLAITQSRYPDGNIPFHSRWGHFQVGSIDRNKELDQALSGLPIAEKIRSKIDLAFISVLLDAGAGPSWKFFEAETQKTFNRSEGIAVATLRAFLKGVFSSSQSKPFQADKKKLLSLSIQDLNDIFQISDHNTMIGLSGRLEILKALGRCSLERPGLIINSWTDSTIEARDILITLLLTFFPIWPQRLSIDGIGLGDTWEHPRFGMVPFHKLSQWLSYSLIEPIQEYGIQVTNLDQLTGLPEYRNGGLFLDSNFLIPKNFPTKPIKISDPLVIEWRALTVACLDEVALIIRKLTHQTPESLPLVKILEGGTWWAGRELAREKRPDGSLPLPIESDGTVF